MVLFELEETEKDVGFEALPSVFYEFIFFIYL